MVDQLEYPAMPHPWFECEPGSTEWAMGLTMIADHAIARADQYSLAETVKCLQELFAEGRPLPWEVLPSKEKPWRSAPPWIAQVFKTEWSVIKPLIAKKDSELATRIDSYVNPETSLGRNQYSSHDNIMRAASQGTSRPYLLNRLRKEAPELFEQVVKGEMSANKAAVQAGIKSPSTTILINPESAAKTIAGKFTNEQIAELINRLSMALEALEA